MGAQVLLAVDWIPWTVGLPLAFAIAAFLSGARAARTFATPALALILLVAACLAARVWLDGPQRHAVGGWGAPLGIELHADGLAAVMLLMTAAVGFFVGLYARQYFEGSDVRGVWFWPLMWFVTAAMNALYLSADLFNLYVTLELLGLAAVALVALAGGTAAVAASLRYLLAALAGSLFYLMGVALLYGVHGTLALAELGSRMSPHPVAWMAAALLVLGLSLKTALFPLHFWLPPAHGGAATPVSALLSALVVKASFYLLLRLWTDVFGAAVSVPVAQLLGALGAAAILWGSVLALRERRLKMLVAYSTVAQIGYLFLLFPLTTQVSAAAASSAWDGGVYHALSHAFAKGAMFLAAGAVILAAGSDDIDDFDGMGARLPLSLFAFALASVSLMGLPPSGGFVAKWMMLESALASGQWWWIAVMILGGLLTAAYLFRVLRHAFVPVVAGRNYRDVPRILEFSAFGLAIAALLLGIWPGGPLALLQIGAPYAGAGP